MGFPFRCAHNLISFLLHYTKSGHHQKLAFLMVSTFILQMHGPHQGPGVYPFYTLFFHTLGRNSSSMGKISRRPSSISSDSTIFTKGENWL